ncbi:MAG: hypothetical protein FWF24_02755 [Alphaproteobacteria bacterium]|nr:hypothetical protein [Alphaproteobacteria bacterium]
MHEKLNMSDDARKKSTDVLLRGYAEAKRSLSTNIANEYFLWRELLESLKEDVSSLPNVLKERAAYVLEQQLEDDNFVLNHISKQRNLSQCFIDDAINSHDPNRQRNALRVALQEFSFLRGSLSWSSASHAQSQCPMFFSPSENGAVSANYDRYGSLYLQEREEILASALGHSPQTTTLLLTSSGQAAFSVIESFLFKDALPDRPVIVSMPYIYFEGLEQLSLTKNASFFRTASWSPKNIIDLANEKKADVVFIDPLANLGCLPSIDLKEFASELTGMDWSDRWLVIDGTLISGGINVFDVFNRSHHPKVLYYESGSKYLQLGLDLQMAGAVVCPKQLTESISNHRRNTGGVMYLHALTRFPKYSRKQFLDRMTRLTKNAETLYATLLINKNLSDKLCVAFPSEWESLGWSHGGGLVAVTMKDATLNNRSNYNEVIDNIFKNCKVKGLPFTRGTSFGFSTFRVAAITEVPDEVPPFLRFSVGDGDTKETALICNAISKAFCCFFDRKAAKNRLARHPKQWPIHDTLKGGCK